MSRRQGSRKTEGENGTSGRVPGRRAPSDDARRERERRRHHEAQSEVDRELKTVAGDILAALADGPARPRALAVALGVAPETVSRRLARLAADGLVEARSVFGDGRAREYVLLERAAESGEEQPADDDEPVGMTMYGEVALSRIRAYGPPAPRPAPLDPETKTRFLWTALANAVTLRQRRNRLEDALERLQVILRQAETAGDDELVVETLAEIATTHRQLGQTPEAEATLEGLEIFSTNPAVSLTVALPAAAHLSYGLGRLDEHDRGRLPINEVHLIAASDRYAQLIKLQNSARHREWERRLAWSNISLAGNFLHRSMFDEAMATADSALDEFTSMDDQYGRSHSLFVKGFCYRVLGGYGEALRCLTDANDLAREHAFERFVTTSLMQMGDVRRCQGAVGEAREMLAESRARAASMKLVVTEAFATSALGAVAYQQQELGEARELLLRANRLFVECQHAEGLALNTRRRAIVARELLAHDANLRADDVIALAADGIERYTELGSPAGVLACEIEQGRMRLDGNRNEIASRLLEHLGSTPERNLIELDPWVPTVLGSFAQQLENGALLKKAHDLISDAHRRLAAKMARQPTLVPAMPFSEDVAVDEMGGEARRRKRGRVEAPHAA